MLTEVAEEYSYTLRWKAFVRQVVGKWCVAVKWAVFSWEGNRRHVALYQASGGAVLMAGVIKRVHEVHEMGGLIFETKISRLGKRHGAALRLISHNINAVRLVALILKSNSGNLNVNKNKSWPEKFEPRLFQVPPTNKTKGRVFLFRHTGLEIPPPPVLISSILLLLLRLKRSQRLRGNTVGWSLSIVLP